MNIIDKAYATAAIKTARETLAAYDSREGLTGDEHWDVRMAARFAADVEHLLTVIDRTAGK